MKKALIASTALVLSAGVAAADVTNPVENATVTISGLGRTGVVYYEDNAGADGNETQINSRLRFNLQAVTSTDAGVDFGGQFRLQWDQNDAVRGRQGFLNAGRLFVSASGLTVEVGNVNTAFDTTPLLYAPELGALDRAVGLRNGTYFAYNTGANRSTERGIDTDGDGVLDDVEQLNTYNGVGVNYSVAGATVRFSYVDPDQSGLATAGDLEKEIGVSANYTWNNALELAGAYVTNGRGIEDNDIFFVGARYRVAENARVGLNYVNASNDSTADAGDTFIIYGDYTLADGLTNLEAYIANNNDDFDDKETDNAFGIGANYDLGGARLGASLQRDYAKRVTADFGLRFDF